MQLKQNYRNRDWILNSEIKKVVICGATSGMGRELVKLFLDAGMKVGIMGRRAEILEEIQAGYPENIFIKEVDVNFDSAPAKLLELIKEMDGIDLYFHSSGIGWKNVALDGEKELRTVETDCLGFTRMIDAAFSYFAERGGGSLAAISSIAGTKALGAAPAYSASKRFQRHYLEALQQLSHMQKLNISVTDIRPGFVDTPLLTGEKFFMLLKPSKAAELIFKAVIRKQRKKVIDWRYALVVSLWRMIPERIWEHLPIK